jgi:hypothetical protein
MKFLAKVAMAILLILGALPLLAQDPAEPQSPSEPGTEAPPPVAPMASGAMEIPRVVSHMNSYGFETPPGWNLAAAASALAIYDTNPLFQTVPSGDVAQNYTGIACLSYLSRHSAYQAAYTGSWVGYDKYSGLDSTRQSLTQTWWHQQSARTDYTFKLNLSEYPTWGGSSFSQSAFGSIVLGLTGMTALELRSNARRVDGSGSMQQKVGRRGSIRVSFDGGVIKFTPSSRIQLVDLLTAPASSTVTGSVAVSYDYKINSRRSVGIIADTGYVYFTTPDYSASNESISVRYAERFRNGWSYSISAGPQFLRVQQGAGTTQTSMALSATGFHRTERSSVSAEVRRRYEMGVAQGNYSLWYMNVQAERAVRRRCFIGAFVNYTQSSSPIPVGELLSGQTNNFIVAGEGGIKVARRVVWFANYGYDRQKGALTLEKQIGKQEFVTGFAFNVDSLFSR